MFATKEEIKKYFVTVSGDVETNPGPICKSAEDPLGKLQDNIDLQGDEVIDMKEAVHKQNKTMDELFVVLNNLSTKMEGLKMENEAKSEKIICIKQSIEEESKSNHTVFEKLTEGDSNLDRDLDQQKAREYEMLNKIN